MIDFKKIAADVLSGGESFLNEWIPGGEIDGAEYVATNPTRSDKMPGSFKVNLISGSWADFATGDRGGDLISLYAYLYTDNDQKTAALELNEKTGSIPKKENRFQARKKTKLKRIPVPENPPDLPKYFRKYDPDAKQWNKFPISMYWVYKEPTGEIAGYDCRIDYSGGGKDVIPIIYARDEEGNEGFRFKSMPEPRPLYNSDIIAQNPTSKIILVEGAKCAEIGQQFFDPENTVFATWPGGSKAIKKANWKILKNRNIILWPDFDLQKDKSGRTLPTEKQPGFAAMNQIKNIIYQDVNKIKMIRQDESEDGYPSAKFKRGFDIADFVVQNGAGKAEIIQFIKDRVFTPEPPKQAPVTVPRVNNAPKKQYMSSNAFDGAPFRCLGYNDGIYYYLPSGTKQVTGFKTSEHSPLSLLQLADLSFWEIEFPPDRGNKPDFRRAANELMRECEKKGVYDTKNIRGCGAWFDRGRVVLHLGDRVIIDGETYNPENVQSSYIYEARSRAEITHRPPISDKESYRFFEICKHLNWESPIQAVLFAGWCVSAPICGAMSWRSHIWITGGAGSGKTFVMNNIIKPVLGAASLHVQSATTEAGIRQKLKNDALPIIFDESEGEDKKGQYRIQMILELMRQSSADTGATIIKGSQHGRALYYDIRSMFCLSSIAVNITQHADASRISVLSLESTEDQEKEKRNQHFQHLVTMLNNTMSDDYCAGLRARSIHLAPIIRQNAKIFSHAIAETFGNQRIGDQYGTLFAGAYSLFSDKIITHETAKEFINRTGGIESEETETDRDEYNCLSVILQHILTIRDSSGIYERSIGELLEKVKNHREIEGLDPWEQEEGSLGVENIKKNLLRHGIRAEKTRLILSSSHLSIKNILKNTPWEKSFSRVLKRIPGARSLPPTRFSGSITRAVEIPIDSIF